MYVLGTGFQWAALPKDLPSRNTVNRCFKRWEHDRTLDRLHDALYVQCREQAGRQASPTVGIPDRAAAVRMQAIAGALEGLTRVEAARLAGMERQVLRDAVLRYNAEGLAGVHDRPRPGRPPRPSQEHRQTLHKLVLDGPDVETTGLSAWTLGELCREVEQRWGVRHHERHMPKVVRTLGLSRRKARPSHPKADAAAREAFAKGGCKARWTGPQRAIPASA